jgi:hypothetical protein
MGFLSMPFSAALAGPVRYGSCSSRNVIYSSSSSRDSTKVMLQQSDNRQQGNLS